MPADHRLGGGIGRGEIGLEVEKWGVVEAVDADDLELRTLDADQPYDTHGDRVGAGRRAQRKGAAPDPIVAGHLPNEVAPRFVHPIEHDQVRAALHPLEALGPARVELDAADGFGFPCVLRAVVPVGPGRADAPYEIERGIEMVGQRDGDLALPDAEGILAHGCFAFICYRSESVARQGGPAKP